MRTKDCFLASAVPTLGAAQPSISSRTRIGLDGKQQLRPVATSSRPAHHQHQHQESGRILWPCAIIMSQPSPTSTVTAAGVAGLPTSFVRLPYVVPRYPPATTLGHRMRQSRPGHPLLPWSGVWTTASALGDAQSTPLGTLFLRQLRAASSHPGLTVAPKFPEKVAPTSSP